MKQVHLVLGNNDFLMERARRSVLKELPGATVTMMRAGEMTSAEFYGVLSPSLFADQRVVVLQHTELAGKEAQDLIARAAADPGPGITLIVEHSGGGRAKGVATRLRSVADVHDATAPTPRELPAWVHREFLSQGVRVSPDVLHALVEGVGSDVRELAGAVEQLVADAEGEITVRTVRAYYEGTAEVSRFDIAEWAVAGHTTRAVAGVRRALQLGTSPVALSAALADKVGLIAQLYSSSGRVDARSLAQQVGAPPFAVERAARVARRWSGDAISRATILVAETDAAVKGQGGDPDYAIEAAVRDICRLAG